MFTTPPPKPTPAFPPLLVRVEPRDGTRVETRDELPLVRLGTWNLGGMVARWDVGRKTELARRAFNRLRPDLVGLALLALQELPVATKERPDALGVLDPAWHLTRAQRVRGSGGNARGHEDIALLSNQPPAHVFLLDTHRATAAVLVATFTAPRIHVATIHFSPKRPITDLIDVLVALAPFAAHDPLVVLGDFNAAAHDVAAVCLHLPGGLAPLLPREPRPTSLVSGRESVDHVLATPHVVDAEVNIEPLYAPELVVNKESYSDHHPVFVYATLERGCDFRAAANAPALKPAPALAPALAPIHVLPGPPPPPTPSRFPYFLAGFAVGVAAALAATFAVAASIPK